MSTYTLEDIAISMQGNEVEDVQVKDFDTCFEKMRRVDVLKLVSQAVHFGDANAHLWSDYSEEASTKLFLVLSQNGWRICDNYNKLIHALHDRTVSAFYHINVEDGLY